MKVIFLKHVVNVAKIGEVKDVKTGYALNALIPQWLAEKLTPELEKKLQNKAKQEDKNRIALKSEASSIVARLEWQRIGFQLKTLWNKTLWTITAKDILASVNKIAWVTLTKKYIILSSGHIKTLWEHIAHVKLDKHNVARIILDVTAL